MSTLEELVDALIENAQGDERSNQMAVNASFRDDTQQVHDYNQRRSEYRKTCLDLRTAILAYDRADDAVVVSREDARALLGLAEWELENWTEDTGQGFTDEPSDGLAVWGRVVPNLRSALNAPTTERNPAEVGE